MDADAKEFPSTGHDRDGSYRPRLFRGGRASVAPGEVTFTKDIAPILQRSCQNCHQPDSVAPMSLITYEDVRPWARSIKRRTGMGPRAGVMPPWYIEKDVGIQHYQFDPSLSDDEINLIANWVASGAPRGNPADMPRPSRSEPPRPGPPASPTSST